MSCVIAEMEKASRRGCKNWAENERKNCFADRLRRLSTKHGSLQAACWLQAGHKWRATRAKARPYSAALFGRLARGRNISAEA